MTPSPDAARVLRRWLFALCGLCAVLAIALVGSWVFFFHSIGLPEPVATSRPGVAAAGNSVSPLLVSHQLDLPGRGEVFPALAATGAKDYWPVAILTVSNRADRPVLETVNYEIRGWSQPQTVTVLVGPRETRALHLNPELLPAAFANGEVRRAQLYVSAGTPAADTLFAQTRPVIIHSASDLYWGQRFANAQYVARWVTPHDAEVLALVSRARRWVPNGRFTGYRVTGTLPQQEASIRQQAAALFLALKHSGITYVSSIFTFGDYVGQAQRIRLPRETLALTSANCIDLSVAFASAAENLGLQPVIIIVPGHAFAGVRLGPGSSHILYLDLTVLPKGDLRQAVARAQLWLQRTPVENVLIVDVAAARLLKIYPLPPSGPVNVQTANVPPRRETSDR